MERLNSSTVVRHSPHDRAQALPVLYPHRDRLRKQMRTFAALAEMLKMDVTET
jgi:hypothetical protein